MSGRVLWVMLLSVSAISGCGAIQKPPNATLIDLQPKPLTKPKASVPRRTPKAAEVTKTKEAREKETNVVETVEPERQENSWMAKTRRQLAQVAKEIKEDLDFHESEGLAAFGPDASEQVRVLRSEMNGGR